MADEWDQFPDAPQADAYTRNRAYAKPAPSGGYLTRLSPAQEAQFQAWVKQNNVPFDPSPQADYDMRGFFKALKAGDPRASTGVNQNDGKLHFGDYWKTPYHKSFSNESQWATAEAPRWNERDQLVLPSGSVVFDERAQTTQQGGDPWAEFPDAPPDSAPQEGTSFVQNARGAIAEPAAELLSSMVAAPIAGLAGLGQGIKNLVSPGMTAGNRVEQVQQAMTYQPRTPAGKAVAGAITYPLKKIAQAGDYVGRGVADSAPREDDVVRRPDRANIPRRMEGSPLAGAVANTTIQALPSLFLKGRGKPAEVAGDVPRSPPVGRAAAPGEAEATRPAVTPAERPTGLAKVSDAAPTKAELKAASRAAYKKAEDAGVVITPESFKKAQGTIASMLEKEGIDPTLHPATTAALKRITETQGPITLEKLETLRRIAKSAESTINASDRRLATKIVDTIDGYADTLSDADVSAGNPAAASAFREARSFYSRARKADELDELIRRAELSAPNFSASGMENAVRTEFRNLAKNERRMRLFTAEERAAITRVAKGGAIENGLRMLGKFAPTGSLSTAISAGGGFMAGGPLGAVALPAMGAAARFAATRMTKRNAARANELVRRGPAPKPPRNALAPEENALPR